MSLSSPVITSPSAQQTVIGLARIVMGLAFLWYGISKWWFIKGTVAYVSAKLPMGESVFWLAVVIETGGGLLLLVGYATRWVAAFYAFYCTFTAFVFHLVLTPSPLVAFPARVQVDHFWENLALAGGFLILMAVGPGAMALDKSRAGS
jgi:putative oxidoreductase